MRTLIAILGVLGTVAFGLAGYLISDGQKELAFKFLVFSLIFYGVDAVLIIADHLNKTPYAPSTLFKKSARKSLPPKDPSASQLPTPKAEPMPNVTTFKPTPTLTQSHATKLQPTNKPQTDDDYKPDDTAIKILVKIEQQICHESELARALELEPSQVANSLRLLERYNYVRLVRPEGRGPYYQITQEGVNRLDQPAYKVPHPSGGLSEPLEKILVFLIQPKIDPIPTEVARHLNIHIQRAILYLSDLERNGYLRHRQSGFNVVYILTDKGRRYLVDRDLI